MHDAILVLLFTLLPTLELRASIPFLLLATDLPAIPFLLAIVIANILLGFVLYELVDLLIGLARRWPWFDRWFSKVVLRAQRRIQRSIDRYGEFGVAAFIAIPLPGSGVYTGALGAYLLGVKRRDFYLASIIGVLVAGSLVTLITLVGGGLFGIGA
ncbi:MAG: COG2426 family protein [Candidatus Woesearchaeota archaeon]